MKMVKMSIIAIMLVCLPVVAVAQPMTVDKILNKAFDSTTGTLKLSLSTIDALIQTALTNAVGWAQTYKHETSGSPANGIGTGLRFLQETSAGNNEYIAGMTAEVQDVTATSEDAKLVFYTMTSGAAMSEKLMIGSNETVANDGSIDHDFRVESNGNTAAIMVDAGNDRVGIFTAAPTVALDVTGNTLVTGTIQGTSTITAGGNIVLQHAGVVDNSSNTLIKVDEPNAATNSVTNIFKIGNSTSGTAAAGMGTSLTIEHENDGGTAKVAATIAAVSTDVTAGSEDDDLVVSLIDAGSSGERFRVTSDGVVTLRYAATIDNSSDGTIVITEPTIEFGGAMDYKGCTLADGDATPDVTGCYWLTTPSNTAPTAITDLDNPVVGAKYCIVIGNATNPSTIADAGNFALSAAWNPGIDDILCLYVQADNDYIEISRSDN